jgi:cellobiose phosphorylase
MRLVAPFAHTSKGPVEMNVAVRLADYLQGLRTLPRGSDWPRISAEEEAPLRAELFSSEQMDQRGRILAASHRVISTSGSDRLLARLAANERILIEVCRLLSGVGADKQRITPAGEWLLDNFYLIEEQIRTAKRHLPKGYSRELPRLAAGTAAGQPRIYDVALEVVAHGDGHLDTDSLGRFVVAYQSVTALTLGELWAIPIMLRLAVIENLRRVAVRIAAARVERNLAAAWADRIVETATNDPKSMVLVIADMARSTPPMVCSFVAELSRRLQGRGPMLALPVNWLEQQLAESGLTIEQLVQVENQQQAADQVSVSNSIGSLRALGAIDWREFVETMSVVEQTLRQDPDGVYARMDFASRDRYRHATEEMAKKSRLTEREVARKAVDLARAAASGGDAGDRSRHVGYNLIDKGVPELEHALAFRPSSIDRLRRAFSRCPVPIYLGAIVLLGVLPSGALLACFPMVGRPAWAVAFALPSLGLLIVLGVSQLAVELVNWLLALLVMPRLLPRMDFSDGIPPSSRTLVVVPTLLTSVAGVESLVEGLEVRMLANRDNCLHFALLTDFTDAAQESLPGDGPLLEAARTGIEALNEKYAADGMRRDLFFLFHRPRRWNPGERIWMGYERKRGKLADLNALLRACPRAGAAFSLIVGDTSRLAEIRYVLTLDTDTQLPRDAARQFVGTMAHPLHRPRYDATRQRVSEGYGILQPRVANSLTGSNRSRYARLYGGEPGVDPYTRAVSDIYQDLFGEGSFIGKGIYDVDAFDLALGGRFPDNRILSHDLIEGCYARAGLLSDVHLYEDYPARYSADVSRRHRWIRGDWQLAGWLRRGVPTPVSGTGVAGEPASFVRQRNPLSLLSQWKILDNLRRSLVPAALFLLLLLGWTALPPALPWTAAVLGILLLPTLCSLSVDLSRKAAEVSFGWHLATMANQAAAHAGRLAFELACLPYEALFSVDAVGRTLWRLLFSGHHLLEWQPSNEANRVADTANRHTLVASVRAMWIGPAVAVATAVYLLISQPKVLAAAAPILLLWLLSPVIAWWLSLPLRPRAVALTDRQKLFLRMLARRTWSFFDRLVGPEDHWLPPDNHQDYHGATVAHRTSPTNIGMALLANLSAYDFGYLPAGDLIERTANTLRTMSKLERHRGHLYNWYDTLTLQPLPPRYISTVDSGNLAGHLLTLRAGIAALADAPILAARLFDGMADTVELIDETAAGMASPVQAALRAFRRELAVATTRVGPVNLVAVHARLQRLAVAAADLVAMVGFHDAATEAGEWARALDRQCRQARDDIVFLAPWLSLPTAPAGLDLVGLLPDGGIPSLRALAVDDADLGARIACRGAAMATPEQRQWLDALRQRLAEGTTRANERLVALQGLAAQAGDFAHLDYDFLHDKVRHLLTIGYNVDECRMDSSYYDLLASEARLCSFVAIAQGQLPQTGWFNLGRLLTSAGGKPVLLSWSGSMFEYLMPLLVMPTYENTLLDQTCKAAVARQIEYGRWRGVPWGISESAYNIVDAQFNYQYRAFGVPGLGLKRGLADDLVVAPYASALALMVAPEEACANLRRLADEGFVGRFGLFEAIDYTPARQRRGQKRVVVRAFMAHHQGMSLLALAFLLLDRPMQRRFESDRQFQAVLLLLQERIPKTSNLFQGATQLTELLSASPAEAPPRMYNTPDTPAPEVKLLSNGRYHVMVTNAGGGYSRWKDLAVTRWSEDGICDNWGSFCYIRDITNFENAVLWSAAHQPTGRRAASYEVIFSEGRAEFRRRDTVGDGVFETYTEIVVSLEDDIELRRVRLTNRSRRRRRIEMTSYAEVVIAPVAADAAHPAFSKLFVQTEILPERRAILCNRRPRSVGQQTPWMLHLITGHGVDLGEVSYETDRSRFIGRTRSAANPAAMSDTAALSGSDGSVLDPIVAIRCSRHLDPEQSLTIDIVSGVAETRDLAVSLIDKYRDRHLADRAFELAWTHSQLILRQLNASEADSQRYVRLASSVIHASAALRADPAVLIRNHRGQSSLWGYGISGDLPIVLLQIADGAHIDLVRQLVQAHAYWRLKGLTVDLVIWNEDHGGYRQQLQERIMGIIASGVGANLIDRPGGIFVRSTQHLSSEDRILSQSAARAVINSSEDRILLQSVARVVIADSRGTLAEQLDRIRLDEPRPALFKAKKHPRQEEFVGVADELPSDRDLFQYNGLGGFNRDGREYVIVLPQGKVTPAPWVNVLANPRFGTVISESGMAYTWGENAHEFRLTPWHNDPVSDAGGEAFYLRDEMTGRVWSPTPLPMRAAAPYVIRHGFGYSVFTTLEDGICSELWVYVAIDAAVKFSVLKIRNQSGHPRRLSATAYVEWVLGDLRAKTAMHVSTEIDPGSGALHARNPYNLEFAARVAFFDVDEPRRGVSGDRGEFIGRNGSLSDPAAMRRERLSGKVGAGLDPCAAMQVSFDLADGQAREIVFRLGVGRNADEANALVHRFRGAAAARAALEAVQQRWQHTLSAVRIETPDPAVNVLANGWLIYQTLACRFWARSGYYQSGGAFGFRDQLQDAMALVHAEPALVREHLLRSASHQFQEGDVLHWWHPPAGRGVRTHCSDDYLWLPLAVCRYIACTGDSAVLDETLPFLEGRPVNPEDDSYYDLPSRSAEMASLYEHCVRAIRRGLRFGVHGLPLIGSGDWNDGMNLIGMHGKGESVWLGFFLCEVLRRFAGLAAAHGDSFFGEFCRMEERRLRGNIEQHGWDGQWYRRAYFDDGTVLGSDGNVDCRIDSISQSWSVLAGVGEGLGNLARARLAMQAVDTRLVRREHALIQLLDPPFDQSSLDPGYIRGYVPGVRENGGQYTHGAIWAAMAFAALGDRERAWELLRMINPMSHALSAEAVATYKVEPYVVAADVYACVPHTGRGGWSWYTGSAGWLYRLLVESLLGLRRSGEQLHFAPCLPADWPGFTLHYRYRQTTYHIVVVQTPSSDSRSGVSGVTVDGIERGDQAIPLHDDGLEHTAEVRVLTA